MESVRSSSLLDFCRFGGGIADSGHEPAVLLFILAALFVKPGVGKRAKRLKEDARSRRAADALFSPLMVRWPR